jgi:hypothetical protein
MLLIDLAAHVPCQPTERDAGAVWKKDLHIIYIYLYLYNIYIYISISISISKLLYIILNYITLFLYISPIRKTMINHEDSEVFFCADPLSGTTANFCPWYLMANWVF